MLDPMPHIVIVGATSAMAEHCARIWASRQPCTISLIGRDATKLQVVADDLLVRNPQSKVVGYICDFLSPTAIASLIEDLAGIGAIDIALIAHGTLPDQGETQIDLKKTREALEINGVSPLMFAAAISQKMADAGKGRLAIIGSVAGDRGRKSNYAYGAAKGMITRFAQGLQHRLAGTNVRVILIKPGPTETPMTQSLNVRGGKLAKVTDVAQDIVRGIDRGRPVVYTPGKWQFIMMIIRHLPRFIFDKMNI